MPIKNFSSERSDIEASKLSKIACGETWSFSYEFRETISYSEVNL